MRPRHSASKYYLFARDDAAKEAAGVGDGGGDVGRRRRRVDIGFGCVCVGGPACACDTVYGHHTAKQNGRTRAGEINRNFPTCI